MKIRTIKKIDNNDVYDINTKKNHNFFANKILVHNCGEFGISAYSACLLGSLNLTKFVRYGFTKRAEFDFDDFKTSVEHSIRFLDNVRSLEIQYNLFPFEKQKERAEHGRQIGLGVMGLADMFVLLNIKFDSEQALELSEKIFQLMRNTSYLYSSELAKLKGSFLDYDYEKWVSSDFVKKIPTKIKDIVKENGMRNITTLSFAPTGTISILAGVSSGIEPIFELEFDRKVKLGGTDKIIKVYHPLYQRFLEKNYDLDKNIWQTAHDIDWQYRIKLQGIIQKFVDNSISSTINLPSNVKEETIRDIYISAWKNGLKGVTVYRDGCRSGILLKKKVRPESLESKTYQIKSNGYTYYITISNIMEDNALKKKPFEIFINSRDNNDLLSVITRLISAIMRRTDDISFVINQLIKSANGKYGDFLKKLSDVIRKHMNGKYKDISHLKMVEGKSEINVKYNEKFSSLEQCESCKEMSVVVEAGCRTCKNCGWSACSI